MYLRKYLTFTELVLQQSPTGIHGIQINRPFTDFNLQTATIIRAFGLN